MCILSKPCSHEELEELAVTAASIASSIVAADDFMNKEGTRKGCKTIPRIRRSVEDIFAGLGPVYSRKSYRMRTDSFYKLHDMLFRDNPYPKKRKNGVTPNGPITSKSVLSQALRFFAGGATYDIGDNHGVHTNKVYDAVWDIVDRVNQNEGLKIKFPNHEEQKIIADEFMNKSWVNLNNCVGCIDGMLVWCHKLSEKDLEGTQIGSSKFFCGRKGKHGLNLIAVCDHMHRFIDVDISHPGSTSDYLAFSTSLLIKKLESDGFLVKGLCLYGDNAFVNTPFMACPFKGVSSGCKDAYNFFQSQMRIHIECAFGILVQRWGCLRKPLPPNLSLPKITALVRCLCILHNFCINEEEIFCPKYTISDELNIQSEGGFGCEVNDEENGESSNPIRVKRKGYVHSNRPNELLDGGEHFEDCSHSLMRVGVQQEDLPRAAMLKQVEMFGHDCRPKIIRKLR